MTPRTDQGLGPAVYLNGATIMTTPTDRHVRIARETGYDGVEVRAERLLADPGEDSISGGWPRNWRRGSTSAGGWEPPISSSYPPEWQASTASARSGRCATA